MGFMSAWNPSYSAMRSELPEGADLGLSSHKASVKANELTQFLPFWSDPNWRFSSATLQVRARCQSNAIEAKSGRGLKAFERWGCKAMKSRAQHELNNRTEQDGWHPRSPAPPLGRSRRFSARTRSRALSLAGSSVNNGEVIPARTTKGSFACVRSNRIRMISYYWPAPSFHPSFTPGSIPRTWCKKRCSRPTRNVTSFVETLRQSASPGFARSWPIRWPMPSVSSRLTSVRENVSCNIRSSNRHVASKRSWRPIRRHPASGRFATNG